MAEKAQLFLEIKAPDQALLPGESQVRGFENQIVIDSWEWGLSAPDSGTRNNRLEPSTLSFRKTTDRSTTVLLKFLSKGTLLPTATAHLRDASADSGWTLDVQMADVRILGYELDLKSDAAEGAAEEKWVLGFSSIRLGYTRSGTGAAQTTLKMKRSAGADIREPGRSRREEIIARIDDIEDERAFAELEREILQLFKRRREVKTQAPDDEQQASRNSRSPSVR